MEKEEKAYQEILEVLKKHKDIHVFDVEDLQRKAAFHLFGLSLKEKYGLDINPKDICSLTHINIDEHRFLSYFGKKYNRQITWSDDDTQPTDEFLLGLSFPNGAFIFGDDYPSVLFNDFFSELKTFNPKYSDTTNKCLYFSMDNAGKIFNTFPSIIKEYREKYAIDFKYREIEKREKELRELKESLTKSTRI